MGRGGGGAHFWAGCVVFASQFLESGYDMSLSQQVLSVIVSLKASLKPWPNGDAS